MKPESLKKYMMAELEKISEISLMSLSPGAVLGAKMAPPLETPGTTKAMEVIRRAAEVQSKTASIRVKEINKKYISPGLSGAAKGALLASLVPPMGMPDLARVHHNNYKARLLGAAMGAAINIISKQAMISPAMSLRSTQRVGTVLNKIKSGPKLSTQIRGSIVGRSGTLPGV
jgi:hypothetical protein